MTVYRDLLEKHCSPTPMRSVWREFRKEFLLHLQFVSEGLGLEEGECMGMD